MKKNKKDNITEDKAQGGKEIKKHLPIKNTMTDDIKNAASQTPGLNQVKTTRDDLFPSDGDNLTN
jgi:hypothetical protein